MSRKTKFRVWNKKYNQWMNHVAIIDCSGGIASHFVAKHDDGRIEQMVVKIPEEENVVQQFTSILDKNSKEIYEGDVVKYQYETYEHEKEEATGEVFFENGIFYFDRANAFATNDSNFKLDSLEVMGNVFETPELLVK